MLKDGSLFGKEPLWTKANFTEKFVKIFEAHKEAEEFMLRLERQMKDMGPVYCKLVAELLWVFRLCDDGAGRNPSPQKVAQRKRSEIQSAWGWSGKDMGDHALLSEEHLRGIGGAGLAFKRRQGKEFIVLVIFVKQWKNLAKAEQERLLASARAFALQWDEWVPVWEKDEIGGRWSIKNRGIRHQIMHLLFPDYFHAIFNKRDKFALIERATGKKMSGDSRAEMDEILSTIPPIKTSGEEKMTQRYWVVGANWDGTDKTVEFVSENRWENGHAGDPGSRKQVFEGMVKEIQPGDKIAIKSTFTQARDLPFDYGGKSCSAMKIKARGVVRENVGDGQHIAVDWETNYSERTWYIKNTKLQTIHELDKDNANDKSLIGFIFNDEKQVYDDWLNGDAPEDRMIPLNQIFYGPPGTGKTYRTV
ncbi:MAG: hypothetical protein MPL62_16495, partial [Alphaproteobacteria bacterium]|nr:hypothetical protein [Alphaproteobacteria bacterium]